MKKLILVLLLLLVPVAVQAGTITITASGFSNTPASAPAGWPAGITWPGSQVANGTKTYTVSDADWIALITWAASNTITANIATPPTPTAGQLLLNWVQIWINGTKAAVQQYFTVPAAPPAPITMQ